MKRASVRATQAIGLTAGLLSAAGQRAGAASIDTAPGFFFSTLPFNDTGTTVGAVNDINAIPPGLSNYTQVSGPDVFYSFKVVTPGTLTFTLTPAAGYDASIYVLAGGSLGANAIVARDATLGSDPPETLTTGVLAPGNYFFVVDSFYPSGAVSSGAYDLNVTGTAVLGIPEPRTGALAATALAAVGWRRRRRGRR
ncbi:MAG TPA: PPC domain-containing protein [Verrucomicrobiales bacterium]|nr:PPC domain-containing protein [Verrucomicrobiales bacterium]